LGNRRSGLRIVFSCFKERKIMNRVLIKVVKEGEKKEIVTHTVEKL
jgi:hypothetical protein